jgi:hypothetical protein
MSTATLDGFPRWAREALGYHQLWRRLGFEPDEMHVVSQGAQVAAVLMSQGLTFTALVGDGTGLTRESFAAIWHEVVERVNAGKADDAAVMAVLDASVAWRERATLLACMHAKGFAWPFETGGVSVPHGGIA